MKARPGKAAYMLDERDGVSYPDGFQSPDGTIYISYDHNRSTDGEILHGPLHRGRHPREESRRAKIEAQDAHQSATEAEGGCAQSRDGTRQKACTEIHGRHH